MKHNDSGGKTKEENLT